MAVIGDWQSAIGSRQSAIGPAWVRGAFSGHRNLSGPSGLARCHGYGRGMLPVDGSVPGGRTLRSQFANPSRQSINTRQYCRGLRSKQQGRVCSILESGSGLAQGIGNAPAAGAEAGDCLNGSIRTSARIVRRAGTHAVGTYTVARAEGWLSFRPPIADCRLPIADLHRPTADCRLPVATALETPRG